MLNKCLAGLVAAVVFAAAGSARANTVTFQVNSTNGGSAAAATAVFSFSTGHMSIDLTNNVDNPTSAASLLGGVVFTFTSGGLGTPSNIVAVGNLIDIHTRTPVAYAGDPAAKLDNWQFSSYSPDTFRVAGNDPLIIGYGDGGLATSLYTAANSSLIGSSHQPFVQKTGHFEMDIAGLTSTSSVINVSLLFGTTFTALPVDPGATPTGVVAAAPLPTSAWAGLSLMGALAMGMKLRRKTVAC